MTNSQREHLCAGFCLQRKMLTLMHSNHGPWSTEDNTDSNGAVVNDTTAGRSCVVLNWAQYKKTAYTPHLKGYQLSR